MLVPKGLFFADAIIVGLHQEVQTPFIVGPDLKVRIQLLQVVPNPSMLPVEVAKAIVHMQCLKQYIRSPCHARKVSKLREDPTRSNVTCQYPTWTSSLAINSNFGPSQKSRQAPEEALCGWAEGGHYQQL